MKKNVPHNSSDKSSNVKEISDGVYINMNRITTDEDDFEKAIEESFKQYEIQEITELQKKNSEVSKKNKKNRL